MTDLAPVASFIEDAERTASPTDLESALFKLIGPLGFASYSYVPLSGDHETMRRDPALISRAPKGWFQQYDEQQYGDVDPVLIGARHAVLPFPWSKLWHPEAESQLAEELFHEAEHWDVRRGVTVPIVTGRGRCRIAMNFFGSSPQTDLATRNTLHVASLYFHAGLNPLRRSGFRTHIRRISEIWDVIPPRGRMPAVGRRR